MDVELIRAFIASPGGLDEERRAAHSAAEEIDRTLARGLGFRLELIGWEETISGTGRPQAKINEEMQTCDLFIGAMHRKWGSKPSSDNDFTSGFEEEFELSRKRFNETGSPEMSMFFKDVSQQELDDAGPDLKRVREFRQRLIEERWLMFKPFAKPAEFERRVRDLFTQYLLKRRSETESARESEGPRAKATVVNSDAVGAAEHEGTKEALFLTEVGQSISQNAFTPIEVARLRLIGSAIGTASNSDPTLGIHDANLIYLNQKDLSLSYREIHRLFREGAGRISEESVPVWTWLASVNHNGLALAAAAIYSREEERPGAITLLRYIGEKFPPEESPFDKNSAVKQWFGEGSLSGSRKAALV